MELKIILWLQQLQCNPLDLIFYVLTGLGGEIFFLLSAIIIYWCVNKRLGLQFIAILVVGQFFTGALKLAFKRPRPYQDGARAIMGRQNGYSFPSGHSQNIANISTQTVIFVQKNYKNRLKPTIIVAICATLTVMFTRMYLGQHYLSDVVFGALLGCLIAVVFSKIFAIIGQKDDLLALSFLPIGIILSLVLFKFDTDSAKIFAVLAATGLGYFLEKRYVAYDVKSKKLYFHAIKVAIGAAAILAIKEGIKPLGSSLSGFSLYMLDFLRYFLMGIFASFAAPLVFKSLKI